MKKIIGVDLDGTLIKDWGVSRYRIARALANIFLFFPFVEKLYLRRPPNSKILSWLEKKARKGDLILIISETFDFHREIVEKWLNNHHIPWHLLALSLPGMSGRRLKTEVYWDILIENDPEVIDFIEQHFPVRKKRVSNLFVIKRSQ